MMRGLSFLTAILFGFVSFSQASRYDSTIVMVDLWDDEDCSTQFYANRIATVVRDHDSTIMDFHFPQSWIPQWDKIVWVKYYVDDDRRAYVREDSISRSALTDTIVVLDSVGRSISELCQTWDTLLNAWTNDWRISRSYNNDGDLVNETKEVFDTTVQVWYVKSLLESAYFAPGLPLHTEYTQYVDYTTNQIVGWIDSSIYSVDSLLLERIHLVWNNITGFNNGQRYFASYLSGEKIQEVNQEWDGAAWININRKDYFQDQSGNDTLIIQFAGDTLSWDSLLKHIRIFNAQNLMTSEITQLWNGSMWTNTDQKLFEYDLMDSLTVLIDLNWNNQWDTVHKKTWSYSSYFPVDVFVTNEDWYSPGDWGCDPVGGNEHIKLDTLNRLRSYSRTWCGGGMSGYNASWTYDSTGFLTASSSRSCTMGGLGGNHNKRFYRLFETRPSSFQDSICIGDTVSISFQLVNGFPPYHFTWISQNVIPDTSSLSNTIVITYNAPIIFSAVDSLGNISIDTIQFVAQPIVNLGSDIRLCNGDSVLLDPGNINPSLSYLWQDGSSDSVFLVINSGTYWVSVNDSSGCMNTDTIQVLVVPNPVVNLGSDTAVCEPDSFMLNPGSGFSFYEWQDGSFDSVLHVQNSGTYWVSVTDSNGCTNSDTVEVLIIPSPVVNLGLDTALCEMDTLVLNAGSGFSVYHWQDGSVDSVFSVVNFGTYWVEVTDSNGCFNSDTVEVFVVPNPVINLGANTALCEMDTLTLHAGSGFSFYSWQDATIDSVFNVVNSGTYWVDVTDSNGCFNSDTVEVFVVPNPVINLGLDTTLCESDTLLLHAGPGFSTYSWHDGSIDSLYTATSLVQDTIQYSVTVVDSNGCSGTDSITVSFEICTGVIETDQTFLQVFPNPIRHDYELTVTYLSEGSEFQLLDLNGKMVLKQTLDKRENQIRISALDPGIYIFRLYDDGNIIETGKLVVL